MNLSTSKVAVIGAGVSGLATAFFLEKKGAKVTIFEASDIIGGRCMSQKLDGLMVCMGGRNIGRNYNLFREFSAHVGSNPYEKFGNLSIARALDSQLVPLNYDKNPSWLPVKFAKFGRILKLKETLAPYSFTDRIRFFRILLASVLNRENRALGGPYFKKLSERFDSNPMTRFFSEEFSRNFWRMLTIRMSGAEPSEFYPGNFGPMLSLMLGSHTEHLKNGISQVFEHAKNHFNILTKAQVTKILTTSGRISGLSYLKEGVERTQDFDMIVVCLPANHAAKLLEVSYPELGQQLNRIQYFPTTVVCAKYRGKIFPDHIKIVSFEKNEVLASAGLYNETEENRGDEIIKYNFSGHAARAFLDSKPSDLQLVEAAEKTLTKYLKFNTSDRIEYVVTHFRPGHCAYAPNMAKLLTDVSQKLKAIPGLFLTGDYKRGASIEHCFESAKKCVEEI